MLQRLRISCIAGQQLHPEQDGRQDTGTTEKLLSLWTNDVGSWLLSPSDAAARAQTE